MQTTANSIKQHQRSPHALVAAVRFVAVSCISLLVGWGAAWVLAMAWLAARASVTAPGPAAADELLALAAATLAVAIATWLVLGAALEVLSHVPGHIGRVAGVWADRLTPALARRVAAFVLGVGMGVASGPSQAVASARGPVTASSIADPGFAPTQSVPNSPVIEPGFKAADPDFSPGPGIPVAPGFAPEAAGPGFTPTAPRVRPQADPGLIGGRGGPAADPEVVVHRGDTLWAIAARHLGPQASDAEIARAWPRWYDLNRDQIGDDPGLILPGQILRVPDADQTASVHR